MWKDTISFADNMNASGTPLHFTYFINSAYFLAPENKVKYISPERGVGSSAIGFAEGLDSINERVIEVNTAFVKGHEIASHTAGHWQGGSWTVEKWRQELNSFKDLLFNFALNNPQKTFDQTLKFNVQEIKGFRAPDLDINDNMYKALSEEGFKYDSSEVSLNGDWPSRDKYGIWHIPISTFTFPELHKRIIAVDYSIWVNQTDGKDILKKGTGAWNAGLKTVLDGYENHFDKVYNSNRAPIVIDDHFSTWNDGLYWEAIKGFAREECGKPNVRCVTFSDLVNYMETLKK